MNKAFIVNRQGRDFVLYAGLLDQAHKEGLKRIHTELVQAPGDANGHLAIVFAEVETEKGVFTGIGDASPQNVGRMIAPHIVRMAETRAKARALRDAINVGTASLEEMGDMEDEMALAGAAVQVAPAASQRPQRQQPPAQQQQPAATGGEATEQQISRLHKLQVALGRPAMVPTNLTSEAAAEQIAELVSAFNQVNRAGRRAQTPATNEQPNGTEQPREQAAAAPNPQQDLIVLRTELETLREDIHAATGNWYEVPEGLDIPGSTALREKWKKGLADFLAKASAPATPALQAPVKPAEPRQIERLRKLQDALGWPTTDVVGLSFDAAAAEIAKCVSAFNAKNKAGRIASPAAARA